MEILEMLIEKYEWAINLYIIGGVVVAVLAAVVIVFVGYSMLTATKKSRLEAEKFDKEFEEKRNVSKNALKNTERNENSTTKTADPPFVP